MEDMLYSLQKPRKTWNTNTQRNTAEENFMTIKNYADVLKFAIQMQINYAIEDVQKPFANEEYLSGVISGLQIAMEKIDASMFLAENKV